MMEKIRLKRRVPKVKLSEVEAKRRRTEYQHDWYLAHRESAKAYQRNYNITHKKKQRAKPAHLQQEEPREKVRNTFTIIDIRDMTGGRLERNLAAILKGERALTV